MSTTQSAKPTIVLFTPSPWSEEKYYGLPLSLLAISALPHAAGYPVKIVSQDVNEDPEAEVLEACDGALLFGVTSLTGAMIGNGIEMCRKVKERYPSLPIVWGGTHASIAPGQTCEHPLVDIVVRGQGEAAFMELVEALHEGRPLDTVPSLHFKRDGELLETPEREKIDIDTLPPMPFELLDMEAYISCHSSQIKGRFKGRRSVTYYTSYGCPFSCSFCSEPLTSNRRWMSKSPEKVIDEIRTLRDAYGVDLVVIEDPIYFVDVRRVKRIADLLIENGIDVWWTASSRLETIKKIPNETWDVLKRSGLQQIFIGVESASPTVLKAIGKRYTADDIVEAARILHEKDVLLVCSYIQGIPVDAPGRTMEDVQREDMRLSAQTIYRMHQVNPNVSVAVLMYTPYPGSVAYDLSLKHGFKPPETLDEYRFFSHYSNQVPWMLREQEVFASTSVMAQAALKGKMARRATRRKPLRKAIIGAYTALTKARYRSGNFKYAVDQELMTRLVRRATKKLGERQKEGMLI